MTQLGENMHQTDSEPSNRIEALGATYFAALALSSTFEGSLAARDTRIETFRGTPHGLTAEEVGTLAEHIAKVTRETNAFAGINKAQVRALGWLASISELHSDYVTANNVAAALQNNHGWRGKVRVKILELEMADIRLS
jgi:hypothetical protein